jgi:hypothetical protein
MVALAAPNGEWAYPMITRHNADRRVDFLGFLEWRLFPSRRAFPSKVDNALLKLLGSPTGRLFGNYFLIGRVQF